MERVMPTVKIFLSYASADRQRVDELYRKLLSDRFSPWMDSRDINPGEDWKYSIQQAIQRSDLFLACLTVNSNKRGFLQTEIKEALNIWREMFRSDIYLIPAKLGVCETPEILSDFQWVNLFEPDGYERLVLAIREGMRRRGIVQEIVKSPEEIISVTEDRGALTNSSTEAASRVLVIEDDSRIVLFITDELEFFGFQVLAAGDGSEGLEQAKAHLPDLIILDVMLPKMNGYDVCRELKRDVKTRHIPILMLSAKGQMQDKMTALEIGADDYLAKPYERDALEARIRALLKKNQQPKK
jgi:CheY-like chemotaxis protein